jgi:hypothetical protein
MGRLAHFLLCLAYAATPSDGFKIVDGVGVLPDPSLARAESPDGSAWIEIENPVTGDLLIPVSWPCAPTAHRPTQYAAGYRQYWR